EVQNNKLILNSSDLNSSIFSGTPLNGVDFTTSSIDGCEVKLNDLRGATFSVAQTLELAKLMGIIIK
ncbi:MAG: pentapeptide repeat-containing protein, partial [Paraclostridium bifermentans]